jgi:hypothetical protein
MAVPKGSSLVSLVCAGAIACWSVPNTAVTSMLHTSIEDNPTKFAGTLVALGSISPLFFSCLEQLQASDEIRSFACRYSFKRMNYIARSFNIEQMRNGDLRTFRKVLEEAKRLSEERNR